MEIIKNKKKHNYTNQRKKAKEFFLKNYDKELRDVINISRTAESLGVSRVTIYAWIKEIEK